MSWHQHLTPDSKICAKYTQKISKQLNLPNEHYPLQPVIDVILDTQLTHQDMHKIKRTKTLHHQKPINLHSIYQNPFISDDIQQFVKDQIRTYRQVNVNNQIKLRIYSRRLEPHINRIKVPRLFHIYRMMCKLTNRNKNLDCNLYFTDLKKKIIHDIQELGPRNINSGSTLWPKTINLWRSEEIDKVFTHEMVHFLNLEYYDPKSTLANEIKQCCSIPSDTNIKPREAYTEMIAIILHTLYSAYLLQHNNPQKILEQFHVLIKYEQAFSLIQTAKILRHFNFPNIQSFLNPSTSQKLIQKTSVISYFIIKSALLYNLKAFINLTLPHNFIGKHLLKQFSKLVFDSLNNPTYQDQVNMLIYIVPDCQFIKNTLRMSCLEFI